MITPLPTVEQLYRPLCTEAVVAWARWDLFKELYANEGRLELLKASAAGFFSLIQDALFDDVLLAISRVTDSPGSGSRENLTLARLSAHLGQAGLTKAQAEFDAVVAQLLGDAAAIRALRNKVLGHRDLTTALNNGQGLSVVRASEVDVALGHIADALNIFERAVGLPTYMYREFIHTDSHLRLLLQLTKALAYDAHVTSGRIPAGTDDLTLPPLAQ